MREGLTGRQIEALMMAAAGLEAKEAAKACGLSFETVKSHRQLAMARIGAKNIAQAVAMAIRAGVIA